MGRQKKSAQGRELVSVSARVCATLVGHQNRIIMQAFVERMVVAGHTRSKRKLSRALVSELQGLLEESSNDVIFDGDEDLEVRKRRKLARVDDHPLAAHVNDAALNTREFVFSPEFEFTVRSVTPFDYPPKVWKYETDRKFANFWGIQAWAPVRMTWDEQTEQETIQLSCVPDSEGIVNGCIDEGFTVDIPSLMSELVDPERTTPVFAEDDPRLHCEKVQVQDLESNAELSDAFFSCSDLAKCRAEVRSHGVAWLLWSKMGGWKVLPSDAKIPETEPIEVRTKWRVSGRHTVDCDYDIVDRFVGEHINFTICDEDAAKLVDPNKTRQLLEKWFNWDEDWVQDHGIYEADDIASGTWKGKETFYVWDAPQLFCVP